MRFADREADAYPVEKAHAAAERRLRTDPAAAQRHLDGCLGGKQAFVKA